MPKLKATKINVEEVRENKHLQQKLLKSKERRDRLALAENGLCLFELRKDEDYKVRLEVVKQSEILSDKQQRLLLSAMMRDENIFVKLEIIKKDKFHITLDHFLQYEKDKRIIAEIVKKGVSLEYSELHKLTQVRMEAAKIGHKLDVLVYDKSPKVRKIVAEHGYGLDILLNDEDPEVREIAEISKMTKDAMNQLIEQDPSSYITL